jgi:hypothetical protein
MARRVTLASAALALADLILGCTVFGLATLGILTAFGVGWLGLASEYAAHSLIFGTVAQLRAAAGLLIVCPLFAVVVAWLGYRSFQLPRRLWRLSALAAAETTSPFPAAMWAGSTPLVPMAEGALWAARSRSASRDYRYLSLLVHGA